MTYEAVHAHPDGESTVARQALTAAECGYDGIVVRNHGDEPASYDAAEIRETYGIDVVEGVEVRASDPGTASGYVGSHRQDHTVVCVHSESTEMNRFAVEHPAVDVLAHPMRGGDFNQVLAKAAAANNVHVEISLADIIEADGGSRVHSLQNLRKLRKLISYYDVPYVVSLDPADHLALRSPRDVVAIGEAIGCEPGMIREGLAAWGDIAARNRDRMSEGFIEPGVRRSDFNSDRSGGDAPPSDDPSA
jgi:ribonuclease P/MRP protein subunit RPP1